MKTKPMNLSRLLLIVCFSACFSLAAFAQTTAFTYQGRLSDGANQTPTGTYNMQFALFGSPNGNDQIGSAIINSSVQVTGGVFTVTLNFTAVNAFDGTARYLEISVFNPTTSAYVKLDPRQQIMSSPYAIRTLSATSADGLSNLCVGCVTNEKLASGIDGGKITGTVASATTANTATTAGNVSGVVAIANGGTGSQTQNFVDLTTTQTIAGNKTFTGTLSGAGISNLVKVSTFTGNIGTIAANSSVYVFAGGTATVTVAANQRITGAASAPLGRTTADTGVAQIGLCYQPVATGTLTNFVGGFSYSIVKFTTTRLTYSASASVSNLSAGTYNVGFCVLNNSAAAINDNDFVNGWVMVTNN